MEPYEHFTRDIAAGMRGKSVAAFFDFDGTVIGTHSIKDMFLERLRNGEISSQELFDREHVGDPRLALKPAVDALQSGRSVAGAPGDEVDCMRGCRAPA